VAVASASGRRTVPSRDFFVNFLTTALEPDELVTAVRFARPAVGGTWSGVYEKFARTHGDFATVSVACALSLSGGVCHGAAIALGACDVRPVRSAEAEACLVGTDLGEAAVVAASRLLAEAADPPSDVRGSANYRRRLIPGLVARAVARARAGVEAP
jgi:carbon-monoxide dehydrogenase medium subunit